MGGGRWEVGGGGEEGGNFFCLLLVPIILFLSSQFLRFNLWVANHHRNTCYADYSVCQLEPTRVHLHCIHIDKSVCSPPCKLITYNNLLGSNFHSALISSCWVSQLKFLNFLVLHSPQGWFSK